MKQFRPQRLSPPAQPGALLKRLYGAAERMKLAQATDRDPVYLARIRQLPCLKCGDCPSEAAHVRMQSAAHGKRGGIGKKPADKWALPLCTGCHTRDRDSQHRQGEALFWHLLGLNPLLICERLYAVRGDLLAMRPVVLFTIQSRGSQ